jgi:hypothetical protein
MMGMLLIGFDSTDTPMDKDIAVLESRERLGVLPGCQATQTPR